VTLDLGVEKLALNTEPPREATGLPPSKKAFENATAAGNCPERVGT
jgi:hypothetical protein